MSEETETVAMIERCARHQIGAEPRGDDLRATQIIEPPSPSSVIVHAPSDQGLEGAVLLSPEDVV